MAKQKIKLQGKELEEKIKETVAEVMSKYEYCEKNGHIEKDNSSWISSGSQGTRAYAYCNHCGMMYERGLTSEEWSDFDKMMNTPMTI